jgi:hypothetical protein
MLYRSCEVQYLICDAPFSLLSSVARRKKCEVEGGKMRTNDLE